MKTIGVVGARSRNSKADYEALRKVFFEVYKDGDHIVSGHCPIGGDAMAEVIAEELGLTEENGGLILHHPDWDKYGKSAGFKRNSYIAEDADVLVAVIAENRLGGTEDTISKCEKMGKSIFLVPVCDKKEFDPLEEI